MPRIDFRGRTAIENHHEKIPYHTLIPEDKLSVLPTATAPSLTDNLIIEGDNLLALNALLPHFRGKVKCVTIDPPYNTGNEHWIYNDNVSGTVFREWIGKEVGAEDEDFNRHDKWCCMMYPRLKLLRELLSEDGVIFVSIDDNELTNLRMLMDEVFEGNFIATFVWKRRASSAMADKMVSVDHEYVVAYHKGAFTSFAGTAKDFASYRNPDNDPNGDWVSGDLTVGMTKEQRPNQFYDLVDPTTGVSYPANPNRVWAYIPDSMGKMIAKGQIIFPKDVEKRPMVKRYKKELRSDVNPLSTWIKSNSEKDDSGSRSIHTGMNAEGTRWIQDIFGSAVFPYSKPLSLIQELIASCTGGDDIILDSFAGSGTTGHAVLQQNKDDQGSRRFILVQMPYDSKTDQFEQKNIAREITRERIKRVIEGVGKKVPALGGSFTYCTLSEQPIRELYGLIREGISWDDLSAYIWQLETRTALPSGSADQKTYRIGQFNDLSIYALYTESPDESVALDYPTLDRLANDPAQNIVVYSEELHVDPDAIKEFNAETGKRLHHRYLSSEMK